MGFPSTPKLWVPLVLILRSNSLLTSVVTVISWCRFRCWCVVWCYWADATQRSPVKFPKNGTSSEGSRLCVAPRMAGTLQRPQGSLRSKLSLVAPCQRVILQDTNWKSSRRRVPPCWKLGVGASFVLDLVHWLFSCLGLANSGRGG